MQVLVIGSRGQLGTRLLELLGRESSHEVRGVDLPEVDISREPDVRAAVEATRLDWIVNCAAYTDVERAETEPEKAYLVNATGVRLLADAALRSGARLLHVSTDYVFSGAFGDSSPRPYDEDDPPGPISVYGASKLAGEIVLSVHGARSVVLRTSWLYGGPTRNFLDTMLRKGREAARQGEPLRVVDDQTGTPTDAWSLARQVRRVLDADLRGTVHAVCGGRTTWCGFAREIFRLARIDARVDPIPSSAWPTRARRPMYSVLARRRLESGGLCVMPPWEEGLAAALAARGGS